MYTHVDLQIVPARKFFPTCFTLMLKLFHMHHFMFFHSTLGLELLTTYRTFKWPKTTGTDQLMGLEVKLVEKGASTVLAHFTVLFIVDIEHVSLVGALVAESLVALLTGRSRLVNKQMVLKGKHACFNTLFSGSYIHQFLEVICYIGLCIHMVHESR